MRFGDFPPSRTPSSPVTAVAVFYHILQHLDAAVACGSFLLARRAHAISFPFGLHQHPVLTTRLISAYSLLGFPSFARLVFDAVPTPLKANPVLWNSLLAGYTRGRLFLDALSLFRSMLGWATPDGYTVATMVKAAGEMSNLGAGRAFHSWVVKSGHVSDPVVSNAVMRMYDKCSQFRDARKVFDEMPVKTVASWNSLMSGYASSETELLMEEVWGLIKQMQREGYRPDSFTVCTVLPLCGLDAGSLLRGKQIHGFSIRSELGSGSGPDFHLVSCLIDMYCQCKDVSAGRRVFDQMIRKNIVASTTIISGYVKNGQHEEALLLFRNMQLMDGMRPNRVTLLSVLSAVGSLANYIRGKEIHGYLVRLGLQGEASLNNALIDVYFKCASLDYACHIFNDDSWKKDAISWSSMVFGLGLHGRGNDSIALFKQLCDLGVKLDNRTCVGVISACGRSGLVAEGSAIYDSVINDHQVTPSVELCACMVDMFCRAGQFVQALEFIKTMPMQPGPSVWGILFASSVAEGNCEIQKLARGFLLQSEPENTSNYVSISNSCAFSGKWQAVAQIRYGMKDKGFKKLPGFSCITLNNTNNFFFVSDKSHRNSDVIYQTLDTLLFTMACETSASDFDSET